MPELRQRLESALAGSYAIEREIGRGGMATVFLAQDLKHHRRVAIKVLHPELAAVVGPDRFLREIETVAALNHPHILPLHDSGEADGLLFFVMPYVDGASLRGRLDRERQLPVDEAVRIAIEIADGLDHAHRHGVIHRDVKPGNVLLSENHAVIADFGLARAVSAARDGGTTQAGLGVGTPLYASPEQAAGDETLDARADVYSLGCVVYEMLAGSPPLTGVTPQQIQARRLAETPSSLTLLRDTVPPALDQAVGRALARVPADRFRTAREFAEALRLATLSAAVADTTGPQPASGALQTAASSRRIWLLPVAAATILLLVWIGTRVIPGDVGEATAPASQVAERQLTTSGQVVTSDLSSDGSRVAYCVREGSGYRFWVQETAPAGAVSDLALLEACTALRWMPGDEDILVRSRVKGEWAIHRISRHGGTPRPVAPGFPIFAISPEGSRLAVTAGQTQEITIRALGDSAAQLDPRSLTVSGDYLRVTDLDWSPTGDWLAVATQRSGSSAIRVAHVEEPSQHLVVEEPGRVLGLRWTSDGSAILYLRESVNGTDLMRVAAPESRSGDAERRIIRSVGMVEGFSVSEVARSVLLTRQEPRSTFVAVAPDSTLGPSASTVQDLAEVYHHVTSLTTSDDGEWIQYVGFGASGRDLYKIRVAGGVAPERITYSGDVRFADWSPDGRYIAYAAPWQNTMRLWVVSAHGGSPGLIDNVELSDIGQLSWEPDRLYYQHPTGQNFGILSGLEVRIGEAWQSLDSVSSDPVERRRRIRATSDTPLITSDSAGRMFGPFVSHATEDAVVEWYRTPSRGTWLISAVDGAQTSLTMRGWVLGWTPAADALHWQIESEVFTRPLDGSEMRLLLTLPERLFGCAHRRGSTDAEFICFQREDNSDLWLLENLAP